MHVQSNSGRLGSRLGGRLGGWVAGWLAGRNPPPPMCCGALGPDGKGYLVAPKLVNTQKVSCSTHGRF